MRSVELFAGAGGLAMGMARAGFMHAAVVEWDHDACETFRDNQRHHADAVEGWPVHEIDARKAEFRLFGKDIAVVSGGPPCQPFSVGGKHRGQRDDRNMFPEAVRAVRELKPKAFIFENVKGLTRTAFASYLSYVHLQLQHPDLVRRSGENWIRHRRRLERHHSANSKAPEYNVLFDVLNAADFGVPQKRERVFFVGFRSDLGAEWSFPRKTHSKEALLVSKWIDGTYWADHGIGKKQISESRPQDIKTLERVRDRLEMDNTLRWRTTRDALLGLPDPEQVSSRLIANHVYIPGARAYQGHTGSALDMPSKTLKAGDHGVPGGENMLIKDDGTLRYFTVREAARLQTFPDEYEFRGAWGQAMRQLGNAVPVLLAEVVARSVASCLTRLK